MIEAVARSLSTLCGSDIRSSVPATSAVPLVMVVLKATGPEGQRSLPLVDLTNVALHSLEGYCSQDVEPPQDVGHPLP